MALHERFERVAREHLGKIAISFESREYSYGTLLQSTLRVAEYLSREIGDDGVLGLCIQTPAEFVAVYLGAAASRTKLVLLDPRETGEIVQRIQQFEITHLVTTEQEWSQVSNSAADAQRIEAGNASLVLGRVHSELRATTSHYRDGDFVVQSTSGSTGNPKGIVLSEENMMCRVTNWSQTLGLTQEDVILCSLTLAHSHGIDVLMLPGLLNGCGVIAPDLGRISPRRIARLLQQHAVSIFSSLPYFYELALETVSPETVNLGQLRHMISGSAPLSDRTASEFRKRFGRGIQQVYGLSEIGPICLNRDSEVDGTIGDFVVGVDGRIEPSETDDSGELVVWGEALARGYLNSPEAERSFFKKSNLWTHDLVTPVPGGLKLVGRRSRFINCGGSKVDPTEVECVLRAHHAVTEAVVTGRAEALRGEQVVAYVQTREHTSAEELHEFVRAQLALHKTPSQFMFVDHIPKNGLGKVQLSALLEATRVTTEGK